MIIIPATSEFWVTHIPVGRTFDPAGYQPDRVIAWLMEEDEDGDIRPIPITQWGNINEVPGNEVHTSAGRDNLIDKIERIARKAGPK